MLDTDAAGPELFLSRLWLAPHARQARVDLRDPYQMHRTLSRAFPDKDESGAGGSPNAQYKATRCLFRVESSHVGGYVLVQSLSAPRWEDLPSDYLSRPVEQRIWKPAFSAGQALAFRLRANPVVKRDGKRVALRSEEEIMHWLIGRERAENRAEKSGFSVVRFTVTAEDPVRSDAVLLNAARFDGVLRVTNPAALAVAVAQGIGPAKGFGFGLLSLSRA